MQSMSIDHICHKEKVVWCQSRMQGAQMRILADRPGSDEADFAESHPGSGDGSSGKDNSQQA